MRHITGTLVRQIALMGGDVSEFVSPGVARRLKAKAAKKQGVSAGLRLERAPQKGHKRRRHSPRRRPWNLEQAAAFPNSSWSPP